MKIKRTPRLFGPTVPIVTVVLMLVVFGMDKAGKISGDAFRNWSFSILLIYGAWEISWHRVESKLKSKEKEL
jgi:hypothetical protein